jgi:hypothetical protein
MARMRKRPNCSRSPTKQIKDNKPDELGTALDALLQDMTDTKQK